MRGAARRPTKESFAPSDRKPPQITTPTAADPWQFMGGGRDSDASFCSSRPSSSFSAVQHRSSAAVPISDRAYQNSAISTINAYLSSYSFPVSFKLKPVPSIKEITETLKFVLACLDYPPSNKLEDDLFTVLKYLNCPIKINKSALKASTPHSFPSILAVVHWLVQIAMYNDHLANSTQTRSLFEENGMLSYALNSYLHYIRGDDDAMEHEDNIFMEKLQQERNIMEENVKVLSGNARDLEAKLESLKKEKSPRELLEVEKNKLEEDIKKLHGLIELLQGKEVDEERTLKEKEKELEAKAGEIKRICEENEELKKKVEEQGINSRDAERMKRELQSVERDIGEAETARNAWEEKCWELDAAIGREFKKLEALQIECNQAIRRLKLGIDFQYELNAKGSTPAEVLGIGYKTKLKPALASFSDNIKESSMKNLEELIFLQQLSKENAAKIEAKRNRVAALQSRIDEVEIHLNLIRKETQDYTSRCAMEARQVVEDVEAEAHNLNIVEKEADELLETSKVKLQETFTQSEEEVQMCARELLALVDSVSKYKEYMFSKISEMKNDLSETAGAVSDFHKRSLPANFGFVLDASH